MYLWQDVRASVRRLRKTPGSACAAILLLHADRGTSMRSKPVALLLADLGVTKTHSRPHVRRQSVFRKSVSHPEVSAGVPGPLRGHPGQPSFLSGILSLVQRRASPLRLGPARAGDGALRPSRNRRAATPGGARCCLSASPGALRTKRPQTTSSSHRRLDQQADSNSGTSTLGGRQMKNSSEGSSVKRPTIPLEPIRCRQRCTLEKGNALEETQNRRCYGSTGLAIVAPASSWQRNFFVKTENSLNFVSTCLKVVDTRRCATFAPL